MMISRNTLHKNRFDISGVQEAPGAKKVGIAGFHGGICGLVGWIAAKIFGKAVRIEIDNKVYYLNRNSIENWRKRVAPDVAAVKDMGDEKAVKEMIEKIISSKQVSNRAVEPPQQAKPQEPSTSTAPEGKTEYVETPEAKDKREVCTLLNKGVNNRYTQPLYELITQSNLRAEESDRMNLLVNYIKDQTDLSSLSDVLDRFISNNQKDYHDRLYKSLKSVVDCNYLYLDKGIEAEVKEIVRQFDPVLRPAIQMCKAGNYEEAVQTLKDASRYHYDDEGRRIFLDVAEECFANRNYEEALKAAKASNDQYSDSILQTFYIFRGKELEEMGELELALEYAKSIADLQKRKTVTIRIAKAANLAGNSALARSAIEDIRLHKELLDDAARYVLERDYKDTTIAKKIQIIENSTLKV